MRIKGPNSLQVVQKLSGRHLKNNRKFSKGYAKRERVMRVRKSLN